MNLFRAIPILLGCLFSLNVFAQPELIWARHTEPQGLSAWGPLLITANDDSDKLIIKQDADKNLYVWGKGKGDFPWNEDTSTAEGVNLLKYDSSGQLLWGRHWNNTTLTFAHGLMQESIAQVDAQGNLIFCMLVLDSADLDPSSDSMEWKYARTRYYFSNDHLSDQVIVKLDSSGNYIWSNMIFSGFIQHIEVDPAGRIYSTGEQIDRDTVHFEFQENDSFIFDSTYYGDEDFIACYENDGEKGFVFFLGRNKGVSNFGARDASFLVIEAEDSIGFALWLCSSTDYDFDLRPDHTKVFSFPTVNGSSLMRASYDRDGLVQGVKAVSGIMYDIKPCILKVAPNGDYVLTAMGYNSKADIPTNQGVFSMHDTIWGSNDFLMRMSADLTVKWIHHNSYGTGRATFQHMPVFGSLAVSDDGSIVTCGSIFHEITLPADTNGVKHVVKAEDQDEWDESKNYLLHLTGLITYFNGQGQLTWHQSFPKAHFAHVIYEEGSPETFYLTGLLDSVTDLDPGPSILDTYPWFIYRGPNKYRSFLMKLGPHLERELVTLKDTVLCVGESITLALDYIGPLDSVRWNTGSTTPSITVDTTGTYVVRGMFEHHVFTDTIKVQFAPRPTVYIGPDSTFCGQVDITLQPKSNGVKFNWNTGDTTRDLYVNADGTYSLVVASKFHCLNADTIVLEEIQYPTNMQVKDTAACLESILLDAENPGCSYLWSTGSTSRYQTANQDGWYKVTISNSHCSIRDSVWVDLTHPDSCESFIYVPNAFTPNGDGLNPLFRVSHLGVENFEMRIYDRWGEELMVFHDPNAGWDGRYRGVEAPDGVYMFTIRCLLRKQNRMEWKTISGTFHLIR